MVNAGTQDNLIAASKMSLATTLEQNGQLSQPRPLSKRHRLYSGQYPAYATSEIAAALLNASIADSEEDETAQSAQAPRDLSSYAGQSRNDGSTAIIAAATWRYHDLRRASPN